MPPSGCCLAAMMTALMVCLRNSLTAFIVFLLNVVLLNMLVLIMAASFERVQDEIALNDSLTRLDMALEAMVYMRSASLLLKKKTRNREEGYLVYCEPDDMDEDASKGDI